MTLPLWVRELLLAFLTARKTFCKMLIRNCNLSYYWKLKIVYVLRESFFILPLAITIIAAVDERAGVESDEQ